METRKHSSRILRRRAVQDLTGLTKPSLYRQINAGRFPRPVPLGKRAVGWLEDEVARWIAERVAERDSGARERA